MDVSDRVKTQWHGKWIWSSEFTQRRPEVFLAGIRKEGSGLDAQDVNTFVLARHTFSLSYPIASAILNITADSRYRVYLNGHYIGRGIHRCEANYWYYNQYDVTKFLQSGQNVVAIQARWYGWENAYYSSPEFPGGGKKKAAKGGLLFEMLLTSADGTTQTIGSGKDTKIITDPTQTRPMALKNTMLGFLEECDTSKIDKDWITCTYNDEAWEDGFILDYPIKTLLRDDNHPLMETFYPPSQLIQMGQCEDIQLELDDEDLQEMDFNDIHKIEAPPTELTHFRIEHGSIADVGTEDARNEDTRNEDTKVEASPMMNEILPNAHHNLKIIPLEGAHAHVFCLFVRFKKEMVGYPQVIVQGGKGTLIDIIPSEKKTDDNLPGIDCFSEKRGARFVLHGEGTQVLEPWDWEGFLYMLIKVRNLTEPLIVQQFGVKFIHMRIHTQGRFLSDNQDFNILWNACAHTLLCCAIDAYLDCPSREQRCYLGDAYVEALTANVCFGEPRLTKKLIEDACFGQRSDGIMYSYHPGDAKQENHIIPDYTLYLIQITREYYHYYGDQTIVTQTFSHFQHAVEWFWNFLDTEDGLLDTVPHWVFIDWSFPRKKHGKWAVLNAQFMDVLFFLSDTAKRLGRHDLWEKYHTQAERMKQSLDSVFWDPQETCYKDYRDDAGLHGVSYQTNAYLLLTDVAPREKWGPIISRIFEYEGIDAEEKAQIDDYYLKNQSHLAFGNSLTHQVVIAQPFFMHHVNQALAKADRFDLLLKYLKKWIPMVQYGETGTVWETWSIASSECHGWSTTPAFDLSTHWLGITPLKPGFESVQISPTFYGLTQVEGSFPSCKGNIEVQWKKSENMVQVNVVLPESITEGILHIPHMNHTYPISVESSQKRVPNEKYAYILSSGSNSFTIEYPNGI